MKVDVVCYCHFWHKALSKLSSVVVSELNVLLSRHSFELFASRAALG